MAEIRLKNNLDLSSSNNNDNKKFEKFSKDLLNLQKQSLNLSREDGIDLFSDKEKNANNNNTILNVDHLDKNIKNFSNSFEIGIPSNNNNINDGNSKVKNEKNSNLKEWNNAIKNIKFDGYKGDSFQKEYPNSGIFSKNNINFSSGLSLEKSNNSMKNLQIQKKEDSKKSEDKDMSNNNNNDEIINGIKILKKSDSINKSNNSDKSNNLRFCRFCWEDENNEKGNLIRPCLCAGTMHYIHQTCLKTWIENNLANNKLIAFCEVCQLNYQMKIDTKYIFSNEKCCELIKNIITAIIFYGLVLSLVFLIIFVIVSSFTSISAENRNFFINFLMGLEAVILFGIVLSNFRNIKNVLYNQIVTNWEIISLSGKLF